MPGLPKIGVRATVENEDGYIKALGAIQKANDAAAKGVQDTAKKFDVLNDTTEYARDVQNRYSDALNTARNALETTAPAADHVAEAIAAASLAVNAAIGVFNAIGKAIAFVADIIGNVIKRVADLGAHIFSTGVDFGKIMSNISAVTKKTGVDLHDLGSQLIDIGSNSVAGPMAVADAYYDVASGISDASISMDVLKASIATAEAGQADLKATTNGLISVLNSYKGGAMEAAYFSDVFTQSVNVGKGTMNEFVAALSPIASMAASSSIGFDELGGAMAFMTQKGLTASQAGTALSGIITQLSRNTPGVTKALRAMGQQSIESSIANNGLAGTLNLLIAGAKKTGQNLQSLVGRVEAMKAVTILGADEFQNYFKTFMEGVDEATSKAREIQRLDVSAQLQLIGARFEGIGLSISQAVLPAFGKFLKFITDGLGKFDWKKITKGLDKVGEALGATVGKLTEKLGAMLENINWDQVAEDVSRVFGQVADYISNIDWNAVIKGVQDFVAGLQSGIQSIGTFFTNVGEFGNSISKAWTDALNFVETIINGFGDILAAGIENGRAIVEGAVQHVSDGVNEIWNGLFGPEGSLSTAARNIWTGINLAIIEGQVLVNIAISAIKTGVETIWNSLFGEGGTIITPVQQVWGIVTGAISGAQSQVEAAFNDVKTAVEGIWNALFGKGGTLEAPISIAFDTINNIVKGAQTTVAAIWGAFASAVADALGPLIKALSDAVGLMKDLAKGPGGGGTGPNHNPYIPGGPGFAGGGSLKDGVNIVGERGTEAIVKSGSKAVVVSHGQTASLLKGMTVTAGTGGNNALATAKSMISGLSHGGGNKGSGGGIPVPVPVPYIPIDFATLMQKFQIVSGRSLATAMAGTRPSARPMNAGPSGGNTNSTINNNRNIGEININGVRNGDSAVQRFARMQARGRR